MKLKVASVMIRGEKRWRIDARSIGEGRLTFESQSEAEGVLSKMNGTGREALKEWSRLSASERNEIMLAYRDARQNGHDLGDLLDDASRTQGTGHGPKVSTVISELVKAKLAAGRNIEYVDGLETTLNRLLRGKVGIPINRLTVDQIEAILDRYQLASRSTLRARLSTLFKFAIRRGYRTDNPCAQLEAVTYVKPPPAVFEIAQVKTAVDWMLTNASYGLGWFALSTACGLRPEEAEKTDPDRDINFKEGFVKVEAQTTKVRQRRVVYPKREAMKFLKWAIKAGGRLPIDPRTRRRLISGQPRKNKKGRRRSRSLRQAVGFAKWPKDITRHTALSYWLASGESVSVVADNAGNSEGVLKKDYRALRTREQAKAFWGLLAVISKTKGTAPGSRTETPAGRKRLSPAKRSRSRSCQSPAGKDHLG